MDNTEQLKAKIVASATHQQLDPESFHALLKKASEAFFKHHSNEVHFERSIFTNWTCAIADCQYCYLSTKPKHDRRVEPTAIRSSESILAEALVCKLMGWKLGYITGGLRVESTKQICELAKDLEQVMGHKIWANFGPYIKREVEEFSQVLEGMGCAIESFDEQLHNFICPSKPLRSLCNFLEYLQEYQMKSLITIILGLGEELDDVTRVIENVKKYNISIVQLCFLKPQANTIFENVPAPDLKYMATWVAKLRIACPTIRIKVALVTDRMDDFHLLLQAGANSFSRLLIYKDFGRAELRSLAAECEKAGRILVGEFENVPSFDLNSEVSKLPFSEQRKQLIAEKAQQYLNRLEKASQKNNS